MGNRCTISPVVAFDNRERVARRSRQHRRIARSAKQRFPPDSSCPCRPPFLSSPVRTCVRASPRHLSTHRRRAGRCCRRRRRAAAVRREGSAVECRLLEQCLRDLPRLQIDDLHALLAPPAEHNHGFVLFRREYEIDGQAAEFDRFAGRIEPHTGRQWRGEKRLSLGGYRRAEQCRKRESEATDT